MVEILGKKRGVKMNWLIYLGGWILGWAIVNTHIASGMKDNAVYLVKVISWTFVWIWICWKFIR